MLPVAIDGSQTPEQIPDWLAYDHFISAIAIRNGASAEELRRQNLLLFKAGLSDSARATVVNSLQGVRTSLDTLEAVAKSADAAGQPDTFRIQRRRTLESARIRVRAALDPQSLGGFDRYVLQNVKSQIVVYGAPPINALTQ